MSKYEEQIIIAINQLAEDCNESNKCHAVSHLALAMLLIEKGIITSEELESSMARATHYVDQEWEEKKNAMKLEKAKEMREHWNTIAKPKTT